MASNEIKQRNRFEMLNKIYKKLQGADLDSVNMWEIGKELHFDQNEVERIAEYLVVQGLIQIVGLGGNARITPEGKREVEEANSHPDKPTNHFPSLKSMQTYDVALSYAAEDRGFAEAVARGLRDAGIKVFFDDFYAADLWGEDLSSKLREVYHDASEFCIMILSENYAEKMWTNYERQQAIERLIAQKGKAYVLPVRLGGTTKVPALSDMIGYLSVGRNEPEKVVAAFLAKIGGKPRREELSAEKEKPHVPKMKRIFTDKEKNTFLKDSFGEIIDLMERFLSDTQNEHPHFDYDFERVTTRKAVFTAYSNQKQVTQFKIWLQSLHGTSEISFLHGNRIDIENDNSMNESIYLEEHEGELKLKPLGMGMLGLDRDRFMSPREVAEYLWGIVCRTFS